MKLYHRTTRAAAAAILREGFRDGRGSYMTERVYTGIWLSNVPLDENEGAHGPVLLSVKVPVKELAEYEWIEEARSFREFLVPARLVNRFGPPRVEEDDAPSIWVREQEGYQIEGVERR